MDLYTTWMSEKGNGFIAGAIAITTWALVAVAVLLGILKLGKMMNARCGECGGPLLQLGYMDSEPFWCPICTPA